MFYIYILYSPDFDKYYIGHTDDPERRLDEHNSSTRMTYTHKFRPWKLVKYFQVNKTRGDALKIERFIKKMKSRAYIIRLIDDKNLFAEIARKLNIHLVRVPRLRVSKPTWGDSKPQVTSKSGFHPIFLLLF